MATRKKLPLIIGASLLFCLLILAGYIAPWYPPASSNEIKWLAYGDIQGNWEPCGCSPLTDYGGLRRISAFIDTARADNEDILVFDLGNNYPGKGYIGNLKIPFITRAREEIAPDAALLNYSEVIQLSAIKNAARKAGIRPVYTISNLRDYKTEGWIGFNYATVAGKSIVFGYLFYNEISDVVEQVNGRLLAKWADKLKKYPHLAKVLLFSGKEKDLKIIRQANLFDLIIKSHSPPFKEEIGEITQEEINSLKPYLGVYTVPLGGRGIIGNITPEGLEWLSQVYNRTSTIDPLMEEYDFDLSVSASREDTQTKKEMLLSIFSGAKKCGECHAEEYALWLKSRHSKAYDSLKGRGKEKSIECIGCHLTTIEKDDDKPAVFGKDVQCETCHGPGRAHASSPIQTKMKAVTEKRCLFCHTFQRSPHFRYETYWQKIKH
ncbi:MAG: hypothetical protein D6808_00785 [Candidatus Dadabacteria bacterium]|nr:MAG: hypothetical protein D6808_00785 [Candidatus Dadabacteria bacterium]